ncbi:glycosyltransferase 61 family protein [Parvibaculum sp.]|uniref:glycosyltransferase 61 family protein n=1 Tax=Parvibaculum sp. TaxID=2024848 RepID=UPI0032995F04
MSESQIPVGQDLHLRYDATLPFGAKDHFFHFLHGYLIPGLSLGLDRACQRISFEDCGPLMNPKIAEACLLAGLELAEPLPAHERTSSGICLVPRWDNLLFRLDGSHQTQAEVSSFREMTERVRLLLLKRAEEACRQRSTLTRWQDTEVLVLKRSPEHPYYAPTGNARFPKYGNSRRDLLNSGQIAEYLVAAGHNAREADMGALPLWEQIMAFRNASAVIGARGAEFAHLFWMKSGATALMFATPLKQENNASRSLAEIFGIRFVAPPVSGSFFSIEPEKVLRHLR